MSKLNYIVGASIDKLLTGLINSNYKTLRFMGNGIYLTLDLKRSGEAIKIIFDIGANVGQSCLSFGESFPNAKIYSFEPIADTYNKLKINTQKYPNIHCVQSALGEEQKELEVLLQPDPESNSLKAAINDANSKLQTIIVNTGEHFCRDNNIQFIDLLKIDTEGYELEVIKGFGDSFLKENVKFIYAEVGFGRTDVFKTHYADVEGYLTKLGFVTSGFYEPNRWGKKKLKLGFCNVLFTNATIINVYE